MSFFKTCALTIFATVCLLAGNSGSAHAQCNPCATEWSSGKETNLGALLNSTISVANSVNRAGQQWDIAG
ncbi:MAG TPA: hypothetical protein VFE60_24125 [Roseiarcus sp.]|jgi:hypothetical protein|nr:hypothetical protein [Roseiarcus sp.]